MDHPGRYLHATLISLQATCIAYSTSLSLWANKNHNAVSCVGQRFPERISESNVFKMEQFAANSSRFLTSKRFNILALEHKLKKRDGIKAGDSGKNCFSFLLFLKIIYFALMSSDWHLT